MPCPYTLRPFDFAAQGMPLRLYLLSFVLFVTSFENLGWGVAYAASAIGESSTSCPSSWSLRTW
jgi:hypothetical protein